MYVRGSITRSSLMPYVVWDLGECLMLYIKDNIKVFGPSCCGLFNHVVRGRVHQAFISPLGLLLTRAEFLPGSFFLKVIPKAAETYSY